MWTVTYILLPCLLILDANAFDAFFVPLHGTDNVTFNLHLGSSMISDDIFCRMISADVARIDPYIDEVIDEMSNMHL